MADTRQHSPSFDCPTNTPIPFADDDMRNLKLAFRTLIRAPFVTAIAALSLGLGANCLVNRNRTHTPVPSSGSS